MTFAFSMTGHLTLYTALTPFYFGLCTNVSFLALGGLSVLHLTCFLLFICCRGADLLLDACIKLKYADMTLRTQDMQLLAPHSL